MTTTTINDTLVNLDGLYNGYAAILESAKSQLEQLDVTDDQISKITSDLAYNNGLTRRICAHFLDDLYTYAVFPQDLGDEKRERVAGFYNMVVDRAVGKIDEYHVKDLVRSVARDIIADELEEMRSRIESIARSAFQDLRHQAQAEAHKNEMNIQLKHYLRTELLDDEFNEAVNALIAERKAQAAAQADTTTEA